jgi:F-type H+-transporting ATPase subunit b
MELDVTTFALEIVNFLVLLWLLNRFLYRPVQAALDARARAATEQVRDIEKQRTALEAKSAQLERERAELSVRRDAAERDLADEIGVLRQKRLTELTRELQAQREKARARMEQELAGARQQTESELRSQAAAFVAQYLRRLASPSTETAVIELFLTDLAQQADPARAALRAGWAERAAGAPPIDVSTAFAPAAALRERVESAIVALMGQVARTEWRLEPELLAGICVRLPGHQLEASLRRGIDAFSGPH